MPPDSGVGAEDDLRVDTSLGPVRGFRTGECRAWLGIPFAAPPIGNLRFRAPVPARPWADVRACRAFGPPAVQMSLPGASADGPVVGSEDCLTLNVWVPESLDRSCPVLVWIHGGGFVRGSGAFHDGAALAVRTRCMIVTLNYRLGPLGFLYLAEILGERGVDTVNPALLDIIAALKFVAGNAQAFGGNPRRVTIFGESAGAMLIGALLATPRARGLFAQAILMSGAARNVHGRHTARDVATHFLGASGIGPDRASELWNMPIEKICAAARTTNDASVELPWDAEAFLPVVDGTVLPRDPLAAIADGASAEIPILISTCRDEMNLFLEMAPALCRGKEVFGRHVLGDTPWAMLEREYGRLIAPAQAARRDLLGDSMFLIPAVRLAEAHGAAGGRSWAMRLDRGMAMPPFDRLGPCHGHDVCLVWEGYKFGQSVLAVDGSSDDKLAAQTLQNAIATFAHAGTPSIPGIAWPAYAAQDRATLLLGAVPAIQNDPSSERRRLWDGLLGFDAASVDGDRRGQDAATPNAGRSA